jgi:hypothetical protein
MRQNKSTDLAVVREVMEMKPIPDYGDHMTLAHFIECCECHGFIDYDGWGYYATETDMSNVVVHPSDTSGKINRNFSHVVWFNK